MVEKLGAVARVVDFVGGRGDRVQAAEVRFAQIEDALSMIHTV